ncbi:hypothetical protein BBP40_011970 [Aspergillus hancockii]|nr:hypothetical protein BBP40_011970 [Aspergillus hancockii]
MASAGVNIVADVFLILILTPMVQKLRMGRIQKIGFMGLFGFGRANIQGNFMVVLFASLLFLKQFLRAHNPGCFSSSDRDKEHPTIQSSGPRRARDD